MEKINEILFINRGKIKKLIKDKKIGKLLAKELDVPLEDLLPYKKIVKKDLEHCTDNVESFENFDEYKFFCTKKTKKKLIFRVSNDNKNKFKKIVDMAHTLANAKPDPNEKILNIREQAFVRHYIAHKHVHKAANLAGYADPESSGQKLLKRPWVRREIALQLAKSLSKFSPTPDQILEEITVIKDRAMQSEPIIDADGYFLGKWQYDPNSALKALELLGKNYKMFSSMMEHTGPGGGPIQHEVITEWHTELLTVEEHRTLNILFRKMEPKVIEIIKEK